MPQLVSRGLFFSLLLLISTSAMATSSRASAARCTSCGSLKVVRKSKACHPRGYVNTKISKNYRAALRDMKREGINPKITSTWRSSSHQASLHRCSNSRACRRKNPGLYYAKPAGTSSHEAGLAVDISGVAAGPRGAKRLTPRGRKIVHIMRKNGFTWRYGLKDPPHFEISPQRAGYKNLNQAIRKTQSTCSVRAGRKRRR